MSLFTVLLLLTVQFWIFIRWLDHLKQIRHSVRSWWSPWLITLRLLSAFTSLHALLVHKSAKLNQWQIAVAVHTQVSGMLYLQCTVQWFVCRAFWQNLKNRCRLLCSFLTGEIHQRKLSSVWNQAGKEYTLSTTISVLFCSAWDEILTAISAVILYLTLVWTICAEIGWF